MPISFPEPPLEVRDFLSKQLSLMAPLYIDRAQEHPLGGLLSPEDMQLPLQVFATDVTTLAKDRPTWGPVEHGWLVFVGETQPCRIAEAASVASSGATKLVFLGLSSGAQADDLLIQIKGLESRKEVENESFTCRVLRVQTLNLVAVWLKASDPNRDLFVPVTPVWSPFERRIYGVTEFVATLTRVAKKKPRTAKTLFQKQT
jgi:hypothetical protein